ncbi:PilZ domain-containing protein [Sphingobium sp. KCTC 72723]|uniref:PilZ domain-containing protein n=1 Tax=Sphingobium sp. KCTC 72723 TaxID=2733867 RepID=UPI00165D4BC2|nr:PilZ domain-containing protein [Sphingobium sp. KCTC 72723]
MLKSLQIGYKPRETRYPVLIPARMRAAPSWTDVVIHNLSAHGALIACDNPPDRGAYVDIRRGQQTIVGRVVWKKDRFFGIRAQGTIDIAAIMNEPRMARRLEMVKSPASMFDRRAQNRIKQDADIARQLEKSRLWSSAFQSSILIAAGLFAAGCAAAEVYEALATPFPALENHL